LALILVAVSAQITGPTFGDLPSNYELFLQIDNFQAGALVQGVEVQYNQGDTLPKDAESFYNLGDSGSEPASVRLVGGSRDMLVRLFDGIVSNRVTGDIIGANNFFYWQVATPSSARSLSQIVYDGPDRSSVIDDQLGGGAGINLLLSSVANGVVSFEVSTDLPTTFSLFFITGEFSATGTSQCSYEHDQPAKPANGVFSQVNIPLTSFSNGCSWTQINSIAIQILTETDIDAQFALFEVFGIQPPTGSNTPTPTQTPTPAPTFSNTPTPTRIPDSQSNTPTGTRTPTGTPSPSREPPTPTGTRTPTSTPSRVCICECPAFTCALIFDPDDDENNVRYFNGYIYKDDSDSNTQSVTTHTNTVEVGNSGNNSSNNSAASTVSVTLAVLALVALLF